MEKLTMEQLEADLKQISAGKILDIATGSGEFINLLLHYLGSYESITAIDSNDRSFKAAEEHFKGKTINFQKMNAYELT